MNHNNTKQKNSKLPKLLLFLFLFIYSSSSSGQSMEWKFFPQDSTMGSCVSLSNCNVDSLCYYLEYIPDVSGTLTSYTTGFFVDCLNGSDALVNNSSCAMVDNSDMQDFCSGANIILLNCSGNNGSLDITAGNPVNLHMICFDISSSEMISIIEDDITDLTVSVDSLGGGNEISEFPSFNTFKVDYDRDCSLNCIDMISCSRNIGNGGDIIFSNIASGHIVNGIDAINSDINTQSFDIYDELNLSCGAAGGVDDITYAVSLINTKDVNGNGLIDSFAGVNHHILQTIDGLVGAIPLGVNSESESSSGDIRGYKIKVEFASHIKISAHQLSVNLKGINTISPAFESTALLLYNEFDVPYGTVVYNGYYNGEADLTGDCNSTGVINEPWDSTGTGIFIAQSRSTVDLTDPCLPIASNINGIFDTTIVRAVNDCGLNPNDRIGGFELMVYFEDVSASSVLDDGTGNAPDDGIVANVLSQIDTTSLSTLTGYTIYGCVFEYTLPIELSLFEAVINKNRTYIYWETASEVNNDYFSIEWSNDGFNFKSIGKQLGKGTTNQYQTYQFIHNEPAIGVNYYRLRQEDYNGNYAYSEIREVFNEFVKTSDFSIYPNPTSDVLNIKYSTDFENEDVGIIIFDLFGNKCSLRLINSENGHITIAIDDLIVGQYIIQLEINREMHYIRIVKS